MRERERVNIETIGKEKGGNRLVGYTNAELTILAVKTSFPRRAKRPRPSEEALRCEAHMSPSIRILYQTKSLSI